MDTISLLVVLGILALFAGIIYAMVVSGRRAKERKRVAAQSLGFSPIEEDAALVERISRLYRRGRRGQQFELRDVSRKRMPDGDLFLFDLVETSGEDDSYPEQQAVAVVSPHLALPEFMVFPRVDSDGIVADMANRMIRWFFTKFDSPVEFPEVPEFEQRYLVSSPNPQDTRNYLNQTILRRLAQTHFLTIHAGGDIFVLGQMLQSGRAHPPERLRERVRQAMDILTIFLSYGDSQSY